MGKYIVKRILSSLVVLLGVVTITFMITHVIPSNPAAKWAGSRATAEQIEQAKIELGLDKSLPEQYVNYLGQILHGDLGTSYSSKQSVTKELAQYVPATLELVLVAFILAIIIGIPLGIYSAKKKDSWLDHISRFFSIGAVSLPTFWVGLMLLIFFGIYLKILPVGGLGEGVAGYLKSFILPAFTQSLMTSALLIRNVRNSVVDIITQDYVDFARSKGVGERDIKYRHILKNAMISTVTLLSMRMAYMLGGSVIIESVFALPGLGKLTIDSIYARDYTVVQAVVLIFAVVVMVINLLTDVLYSILEPRVSY